MTDRQILEVLLNKVDSIDNRLYSVDRRFDSVKNRLTTLEGDISNLKRQMTKSTKELKEMDKLMLDEVERVHTILIRHTQDKTVHTA